MNVIFQLLDLVDKNLLQLCIPDRSSSFKSLDSVWRGLQVEGLNALFFFSNLPRGQLIPNAKPKINPNLMSCFSI